MNGDNAALAYCQSACPVSGRSWVRIPSWVIPFTSKWYILLPCQTQCIEMIEYGAVCILL